MSAAEQLRQEGREEVRLKAAKSMLQDKESIDKIAKWTGLSEEELERLKK
jgi:predicted transposase/invertase (TIGR01784 family)